MAPVTDL